MTQATSSKALCSGVGGGISRARTVWHNNKNEIINPGIIYPETLFISGYDLTKKSQTRACFHLPKSSPFAVIPRLCPRYPGIGISIKKYASGAL